MKRSELNKLMKDAVEFIEKMNFKLPPFVYWSPEEWKTKGSEYDEIRDNMLGWDITDFGSGGFYKTGLLLVTLRNGNFSDKKYVKSYAEKLLIAEDGQVTPFHFHWSKMEDIINRGGGVLVVEVYNRGDDDGLADTPVTVTTDGHVRTVPAGTKIRLMPGESITLPPYQYHAFWAEKGNGKVLIGEVSMVNDDNTDNRFYEDMGRFPKIEEDEPPLYLLCNEYPEA